MYTWQLTGRVILQNLAPPMVGAGLGVIRDHIVGPERLRPVGVSPLQDLHALIPHSSPFLPPTISLHLPRSPMICRAIAEFCRMPSTSDVAQLFLASTIARRRSLRLFTSMWCWGSLGSPQKAHGVDRRTSKHILHAGS